MEISQEFTSGGAAAILALGIREIVAGLIKWKKTKSADTPTYKPNLEWETYCRNKFDAILLAIQVLDKTQALTQLKVEHLEHRISVNEKKNGKVNSYV